jgi:mercuric transport protein
MRKAILAFAVMAAAFAPFAGAQELKSATLYADKIFCSACAATITKALRGVPGVSKVSVDVDSKEVTVRFDPAKAKVEDLTAATARSGFPSSVRKVQP